MKKRRRFIWAALSLLGSLAIGLGVARAQILPVDPTTKLPIPSPVTVSIFQGAVDVTNTWLPVPGESVQIVVNGVASPVISLVFDPATAGNPIANAALTTSAYPGQCTNFANPPPLAPNAPDFDLVGNNLTPTDCGGMAVISVNPGGHTFILPQDSDFDGMPDIWENPLGNLAANLDIDEGPLSGSPCCDGIASFDEYRGFRVSGTYIRTDPRVKDVFVHLVNPQCLADGIDPLTSPASLLGGGATTYPTVGGLFDKLANLSGTQVHALGYSPGAQNYTTDEWVDKFFIFTIASGFEYKNDPSDPATTTIAPPDDRQINVNALYPVLDIVTGNTRQKGLRITECVVLTGSSPLGVSGLGSANDNAVLYTQRIVNHIDSLIADGAGRELRLSTHNGTTWTGPDVLGAPTDPNNVNRVKSEAMQFYVAHEIGHSINLTPTVQGTNKVSYGYHHAPETGSNLDQAIVNKVDRKSSGFNTFYIPSIYNSADETSFKLRN